MASRCSNERQPVVTVTLNRDDHEGHEDHEDQTHQQKKGMNLRGLRELRDHRDARRDVILTTCAGAILIALGVALSAQPPPARARQRTPVERAADRIRALEREAEALASQEGKLLVELRKLEIERQLKVEEIARIERDRKDTERQLADSTSRAEALRRTADADRPDIESRLVQLYKLGQAGYWRLLLDVEDLRSVGRAYRTAAAMTHLDRERIETHRRTLDALATEKVNLQSRSRQLATLGDQATRARVALDRAVQSRTTLVASIDARRDLNAQMTSELQAAQQRLQASVTQLEANGGPVNLPLRAFQGALPWPLRGAVTSPFGRQASSRFGTSIVRNGIEMGVAEGQPVRAVHEGSVAFADSFTGYGNLVIIEHGDRVFSLYGHLGPVQVQRGDRVEAQSILGRSGRNPSGTPAFYFELRVDGKPVDPLQWLQKGIP
jgi:murein hydrolase activator